MKVIQAVLAASLLFSCAGQSSNVKPEAPETTPESETKTETDAETGTVTETTTETRTEDGRTVVTETRVEILGPIAFSEGTTLAESSNGIIEAIANTLQANTDIELIAVIASAESKELAEGRSQVVIESLVGLGVSQERLEMRANVSSEPSVLFQVLRRATKTSD